MITHLEAQLFAAPQQQWATAACSYGLVVDVLAAAEQALRQAGLHASAAQLEALAREFRRQRRNPSLMGQEPPIRPRQEPQLPVRQQRRQRRRLPRLKQQ